MNEIRQIQPGVMSGTMTVPYSKSLTHRLLVIGALSGNSCRIFKPLISEDTRITFHALQQMGFETHMEYGDFVFSGERKAQTVPVEIFVGNSGTSARFLTALAAFLPGVYRLDGTARMRQRPMRPLIQALQHLGAEIRHQNGFFPLEIHGGQMFGGEVTVDASQSSQFLSALLLVAPSLTKSLKMIHRGKVSSMAYVEITLELLRQAGITVQVFPDYFEIPGRQQYRFSEWLVEGDYSSASYYLAGAAISGGTIRITNLQKNSVQGDREILHILEMAGAEVKWDGDTATVSGPASQAVDVDMLRYPDLVPAVAVLSLFARGTSRLRNVTHLRYKESDRIQAITENISLLGGNAFMDGPDLVIAPGSLHGATLPVFNDHRIAMSFALAGLRIPGVSIENPACVGKSYPDFWDDFERTVIPTEQHTI